MSAVEQTLVAGQLGSADNSLLRAVWRSVEEGDSLVDAVTAVPDTAVQTSRNTEGHIDESDY